MGRICRPRRLLGSDCDFYRRGVRRCGYVHGVLVPASAVGHLGGSILGAAAAHKFLGCRTLRPIRILVCHDQGCRHCWLRCARGVIADCGTPCAAIHGARRLLPSRPGGTLLAITFAIYTFGGVEFVAVTSGESRSAKEVAKAVWMTFFALTAIYLGAIVVLVGVMPWNRAGVTESPFVSVFRLVRIPGAGSLMNFVVLTAALSAANAALYISSRMLFSLARNGWAPASLGHLNRAGSPNRALLVS